MIQTAFEGTDRQKVCKSLSGMLVSAVSGVDFKQVQYGVYVRMALILTLLEIEV